MRWQINGWPPLASHLMAFVVGVLGVHMAGQSRQIQGIRLEPGQLLVRFSQAVQWPPAENTVTWRPGQMLQFVASDKQKNHCRLGSKGLRLWQKDPAPIVQLSAREWRELSQTFIVLERRYKHWQVMSSHESEALLPCSVAESVSYDEAN